MPSLVNVKKVSSQSQTNMCSQREIHNNLHIVVTSKVIEQATEQQTSDRTNGPHGKRKEKDCVISGVVSSNA